MQHRREVVGPDGIVDGPEPLRVGALEAVGVDLDESTVAPVARVAELAANRLVVVFLIGRAGIEPAKHDGLLERIPLAPERVAVLATWAERGTGFHDSTSGRSSSTEPSSSSSFLASLRSR